MVGNGVVGLGRICCHICSLSGMGGGRVGVEVAENLFGRRIVGSFTPHSVVTIVVGISKVAVHRVVAFCIGTGTTRGVGDNVIGAVSVLQTTTRVGAIQCVACWASGVDGSVGGICGGRSFRSV